MNGGACLLVCLAMVLPDAAQPLKLHRRSPMADMVRLRPTGDWRKDPFRYFADTMTEIADRLEDDDTAEVTQQREAMVLSRLDEMIAALEKACSGGSGGQSGTNTPTLPATGTGPISGVDQQGPLRDPGRSRRRWGELPPSERQRIIQSRTEGFPPGYEGVLEEYFHRLAQEQMIDSAVPQEKP